MRSSSATRLHPRTLRRRQGLGLGHRARRSGTDMRVTECELFGKVARGEMTAFLGGAKLGDIGPADLSAVGLPHRGETHIPAAA